MSIYIYSSKDETSSFIGQTPVVLILRRLLQTLQGRDTVVFPGLQRTRTNGPTVELTKTGMIPRHSMYGILPTLGWFGGSRI